MTRNLLLSISILLSIVSCGTTSGPAKHHFGNGSLRQQPAEEPLDQKHISSSYNVGMSYDYLEKGDPERAKTKILTALELTPDWPPALDGMGLFLMKTGHASEAEPYFLRAIRESHESGDALNNYGIYLCNQKRYDESITYFQKAVRDPRYISMAGAYENAGMCSEMKGDTLAAEQYYSKALENNPQTLKALYQLSQIYYKQGKDREAYAKLGTYFALNGFKTPESLWLSVQLSRKLGYLNEASSSALLLKGSYPNSPQAKLLKSQDTA